MRKGFRYQHVGILNTKFLPGGFRPTQGPNASGFGLQWNIGLKEISGRNAFSNLHPKTWPILPSLLIKKQDI